MKIVYIESDKITGRLFSNAVKNVAGTIHCNVIATGLGVNSFLRDIPFVPHCIFIHHDFRDIPCKTLISLIRQQGLLHDTKIIVVCDYLTRVDFKGFELLKINGFMPLKMNLVKPLRQILMNTLIPI